MAFEAYNIAATPTVKDTNYITLSIIGGPKPLPEGVIAPVAPTKTKPLQLLLAIGPGVVESTTWKAADKIACYFGTGDDKGKMLLRIAGDEEVGAVTLSYYANKGAADKTRALKLQRSIKPVAPIADFVNTALAATKVAFVWDEAQKGLVVTLPEGFFTA